MIKYYIHFNGRLQRIGLHVFEAMGLYDTANQGVMAAIRFIEESHPDLRKDIDWEIRSIFIPDKEFLSSAA